MGGFGNFLYQDWKKIEDSEFAKLLPPPIPPLPSIPTVPLPFPGQTEPQASKSEEIQKLERYFLGFWISLACAIPTVGAGVVPAIIFWCLLLYNLWTLTPKEVARTTPGKAVGFLFIPFFSFYWIFVAFYGLACDMNAYFEKTGVAYRVKKEFCLTFAILSCASFLPYVCVPIVIAGVVFLILGTISLKNGGIELLKQRG